MISSLTTSARMRARTRRSTTEPSPDRVVSALIDGMVWLPRGSTGSVAAHLSIGATEPQHRYSRVLHGAPKVRDHRAREQVPNTLVAVDVPTARASGPASRWKAERRRAAKVNHAACRLNAGR